MEHQSNSWESWPPMTATAPPAAPPPMASSTKRSHGDLSDDGGAVGDSIGGGQAPGAPPPGGSFDDTAERSFKRLRIEGPSEPPTLPPAAPYDPRQPQLAHVPPHAQQLAQRAPSPYYQPPGQETVDLCGGRAFVPVVPPPPHHRSVTVDSSGYASHCSTDADDATSDSASHAGSYRGNPLYYPAGTAMQDYSNVNRLLGELHEQRRRREEVVHHGRQQQQPLQLQHQQQQLQQQYAQQVTHPLGPSVGTHQQSPRRYSLPPSWETNAGVGSAVGAAAALTVSSGHSAQGGGRAGLVQQHRPNQNQQQDQRAASYGRPPQPLHVTQQQQHNQQQQQGRQQQQHVPSWRRSVRLPSDSRLY